MIAGIDRLRRAQAILTAEDGSGFESAGVLAAALEFWSARFDRDQWPVPLRTRAAMLERTLLARGSIRETVARADAAGIVRLRDDLLAFAAAAEQFAE